MKTALVKLSDLRRGARCVIDSFTDDLMKQKLLEMGCLPGETITIDRFAPFGCPMAINVSGSTLSIRVDEAQSVIVKPLA
jgi:ferrous iron transport protein A